MAVAQKSHISLHNFALIICSFDYTDETASGIGDPSYTKNANAAESLEIFETFSRFQKSQTQIHRSNGNNVIIINNNKNNILASVSCQLNAGGGHSCEFVKVTSLSQAGICIKGNQICIKGHMRRKKQFLKIFSFSFEKKKNATFNLKNTLGTPKQ